jgi:hypothetical protein
MQRQRPLKERLRMSRLLHGRPGSRRRQPQDRQSGARPGGGEVGRRAAISGRPMPQETVTRAHLRLPTCTT